MSLNTPSEVAGKRPSTNLQSLPKASTAAEIRSARSHGLQISSIGFSLIIIATLAFHIICSSFPSRAVILSAPSCAYTCPPPPECISTTTVLSGESEMEQLLNSLVIRIDSLSASVSSMNTTLQARRQQTKKRNHQPQDEFHTFVASMISIMIWFAGVVTVLLSLLEISALYLTRVIANGLGLAAIVIVAVGLWTEGTWHWDQYVLTTLCTTYLGGLVTVGFEEWGRPGPLEEEKEKRG